MNLSEEYISKYATLKAIEKELDEIPNGWIEHRSYKLEHDYYRVSETSLKKYEEGEDISRIKADFEKRKHLKRQKKECTQQLKMLREALRAQGIDPSQIIKNFNREQKRKLRAIREDQADIKKARKKKYGKNYTLKTMRGEYVTSKSEMMIADTLFRNGISYEYEMEIKIGNVVLHPDFVIFINGMVFFWEHCGMMDDPFYRDSWHSRRKLYEDNGIIEGVNLIITTETRERMLTQEAINNIISTYFRIKPV